MRYFIETYGCQMNKAESSALETICAERGWQAAEGPESANLILINTCSVRITAENRAWGRISYFAAQKKLRSFTFVVTGCMAERLKKAMQEKQPAIDYVLGNFQKQAFGLILDATEAGRRPVVIEESPVFQFARTHMESGSFKAFVPIMHGCDNFCSYCIVPYVRGREVSRAPDAIMEELRALADRGVKEVTLLGQNVNSYSYGSGDDRLSFPALLARIAAAARPDGIERIRFVTSHPKDLSEETLRVLAANPIFARHIHLCVQHGSNAVLQAMNRKYTVESYVALVELIRKYLPDVSLSTDILIGFPGETEADVEATLELMKTVRFAYAFMYHFNPREGTPAAGMPGQIPSPVKLSRLARVIALQKEIGAQVMRSFLGREMPVLVESISRKNEAEVLARTDQDMMVVCPGSPSLIGKFATVKLLSLKGNTFKGILLP